MLNKQANYLARLSMSALNMGFTFRQKSLDSRFHFALVAFRQRNFRSFYRSCLVPFVLFAAQL